MRFRTHSGLQSCSHQLVLLDDEDEPCLNVVNRSMHSPRDPTCTNDGWWVRTSAHTNFIRKSGVLGIVAYTNGSESMADTKKNFHPQGLGIWMSLCLRSYVQKHHSQSLCICSPEMTRRKALGLVIGLDFSIPQTFCAKLNQTKRKETHQHL